MSSEYPCHLRVNILPTPTPAVILMKPIYLSGVEGPGVPERETPDHPQRREAFQHPGQLERRDQDL